MVYSVLVQINLFHMNTEGANREKQRRSEPLSQRKNKNSRGFRRFQTSSARFCTRAPPPTRRQLLQSL